MRESDGTKLRSICKTGSEPTVLKVIKEQSEGQAKRKESAHVVSNFIVEFPF